MITGKKAETKLKLKHRSVGLKFVNFHAINSLQSFPFCENLVHAAGSGRVKNDYSHKTCAVFIWGYTWERTSRTNLVRSDPWDGLCVFEAICLEIFYGIRRIIFGNNAPNTFTVCQMHVASVYRILNMANSAISAVYYGRYFRPWNFSMIIFILII